MKHPNKLKKMGLAALLLTASASLVWANTPAEIKMGHFPPVSSSHLSKAEQTLQKKRHSLVKEAIKANDEIIKTIEHLKKKDRKAAYKSLADATGKLDVVMAREPGLKMAPIGVRMRIIDLSAKSKDIKKAIAQARKQLDKGNVQAARALLNPLVSEIRVTTDYIPMETYPAAIKRAVNAIQQGHLNLAKAELYTALGTIVSNEEVFPLPPLNAESDVLQAEQLAKKNFAKNKKAIVSLLDNANQQLSMANRLGYGKYRNISKEITKVKGKINGNVKVSNLFSHIKQLFKEVQNKV